MVSLDNQRDAVLVLSALPGVGPVRFNRLTEHFGGPEKVFSASRSDLLSVRDIGKETAEAILQWEQHFNLSRELQLMERSGVRYVIRGESGYPRSLSLLGDAPPGLYVKGEVPPVLSVAIIGTRRPSIYGRGIARKFAAELARAGACVISGLARGIDTEAHEGALEGGKTIAVLGCGIDYVYPPENRQLYERIANSGALISEFPFGRKPDAQTFPQRNRLVSGISDGVLVVESDTRGGSMITARFAAEQGRTVFAVPGRIDQASSRGCHALIRDGASLVTSVDDILHELQFMQLPFTPEALDSESACAGQHSPSHEAFFSDLNEKETTIAQCFVDGEALHPDVVSQRTQLPYSDVSAALMMLELKRRLIKRTDGRFERV